MNFGKGVSLTWNISKCGGVLPRSCYPSLKGESLVLEHVIVCFIGYACNSSCYKFLVIRSDILESYAIIESKNAIFFEHVFPLKKKEKVLHDSIEISNDFVDDV